MKRFIIGLAIVVMCFALSSCAYKATNANSAGTNKYLCGAYSDCRSLTEQDVQLFESVYSYDLKLKPQSVATQVVAGTNYKFVCTDALANDILVYVFKPLPNRDKPRVTGIEMVGGNDTPEFASVAAQIMYDDVLSEYCAHDGGQKEAFGKYASAGLLNLLAKVDEAITKGEVEPMIYGWDCDPWIMAQDCNQPKARIVKVRGLKDTNCLVDVVISDGEDRDLTLKLVKENNRWKVDDFVSPAYGSDSYAEALRRDLY